MRTVTYDETKWKLVPVEPDDQMQAAGAGAIRFDTTVLNKIWTANAVFRANVAAAPDHPDTAGDAEDAARLDRMESALEQIQAWASAYPIGMFPEPDWAASAKVLKAAGLSLDAISAANMRHVITRVQEIADNAMRASIGDK